MPDIIRPPSPSDRTLPLPEKLADALGAREAQLRTESLELSDARALRAVGDELTADQALRATERGELLLYVGDYHNARQLLSAMRRRLERRRRPLPRTPLEAFRAERALRGLEHRTLSRVLVALGPDGTVAAKRAPDVRAASEAALGSRSHPALVPLIELLGMIGAAEWAKKGVLVPGLSKPIFPTYGVFAPTRFEPALLAAKIPDVTGRTFIDVGTGTGLLALILLTRGAASGTASDLDSRAVGCARANAQRLGFGERLRTSEADLFPDGAADLVVANPPWLPERAHTRLDRAIYDPGNHFLSGFLTGLTAHLTPNGRGYLLISDFAERVGLRPPSFLANATAAARLSLTEIAVETPAHGKAKDSNDPLHAVRAAERVRLLELRPQRPS